MRGGELSKLLTAKVFDLYTDSTQQEVFYV